MTFKPYELTLSQSNIWHTIRLLALYRLLIAAFLSGFFLFFDNVSQNQLGNQNQSLFTITLYCYLFSAIIWLLGVYIKKPRRNLQLSLQVATDIILIVLLAYSSGGFSGGLGIVLIVSIGSSVLLLSQTTGLIFTFSGASAILLTQLYTHWAYHTPNINYSQILGLEAALFGTVALLLLLKRRINESEKLAAQRGVDLENMAALNEYIIQQMEYGVIVIDAQEQIKLLNQAAYTMLNISNQNQAKNLRELSAKLYEQYQHWLHQPEAPASSKNLILKDSPFKLQPHFKKLGNASKSGILILLEDTTPYSRQFQNIKLASLGRLTASIAHELRNPLSAIQNSAQLLHESTNLLQQDSRLITIIQKQTERMNRIIENIMQLSHKEKVTPTGISLKTWLMRFKHDFCNQNQLEKLQIKINLHRDDSVIYFDASQLNQILWNLGRNSLKYGSKADGQVTIYFESGIDTKSNAPYLEIGDYGNGVPSEIQDQIFEPFFSSSNDGLGLGLYIVRELCTLNQASIEYLPDRQGCCFRLQFANPTKAMD